MQLQSRNQKIVAAGSATSHCETESDNVTAKREKSPKLPKVGIPKSHHEQIQVKYISC